MAVVTHKAVLGPCFWSSGQSIGLLLEFLVTPLLAVEQRACPGPSLRVKMKTAQQESHLCAGRFPLVACAPPPRPPPHRLAVGPFANPQGAVPCPVLEFQVEAAGESS